MRVEIDSRSRGNIIERAKRVEDLQPDAAHLLGLVLAAIVLFGPHLAREMPGEPGQQKANMPTPVPKGDPRPKVWLTVDFGDGNRTAFSPVEWHDTEH